LALVFSVFWFIANWSVNAALGYTSVASATILSTMSGGSFVISRKHMSHVLDRILHFDHRTPLRRGSANGASDTDGCGKVVSSCALSQSFF
jgi:hypothetical protein